MVPLMYVMFKRWPRRMDHERYLRRLLENGYVIFKLQSFMWHVIQIYDTCGFIFPNPEKRDTFWFFEIYWEIYFVYYSTMTRISWDIFFG